ncbi:MAG: flagellar motor protein MotB [Parvularculaceae bacterium]
MPSPMNNAQSKSCSSSQQGGQVRPIIIRKKKIIKGGGHHGGAWKVAYADFVTAMMAFFLLMWLLNATTEDQRKGLADYFNPTIPVSRQSGGGSSALDGSSVMIERAKAMTPKGSDAKDKKSASSSELKEKSDKLLEKVLAVGKADLSDHIEIHLSPEGLVIELIEKDGGALFELASTKPNPVLLELLQIISESFQDISNSLKIVGHTDSRGFGAGVYSNWELSADRANAARRALIASGFDDQRIGEVSGKADREPRSDDPFAAENRRISITILKN